MVLVTHELMNVPKFIVEITNNIVYEEGSLIIVPLYSKASIDFGFQLSEEILIDAFRSKIVEHNKGVGEVYATDISIEMDDYLSACEEAEVSKQTALKNLKVVLNMIYGASIEWEEKEKKKDKDFIKQRLCGSFRIREGYITICFTTDFVKHVLKSSTNNLVRE